MKEMKRDCDVSRVTQCKGKEQLADCITKRGALACELLRLFQTVQDTRPRSKKEITRKEESVNNVCVL